MKQIFKITLLIFLIVFMMQGCSKKTPPIEETPEKSTIVSVLSNAENNTLVQIEGIVFGVSETGFYLADSQNGRLFVASDDDALSDVTYGAKVNVVGSFSRDNHVPVVQASAIDVLALDQSVLEPITITLEGLLSLDQTAAIGTWYRWIEVIGVITYDQPSNIFYIQSDDGELSLSLSADSKLSALQAAVDERVTMTAIVVNGPASIELAFYNDIILAATPLPDTLEELTAALEALFPESLDAGNLSFPTTHPLLDGTITWETSHESVVSTRGIVSYSNDAVDVTITARFMIDGIEHAFNFMVTVEGMGHYRSWEDYVHELYEMEATYPDLVKLHIIGHSYLGHPIYAIELSDAPGVADGRPESVHTALVHAREWTSGEMAMDLAWYLLEGYLLDEQVTSIMQEIRTWILPVKNPDGFILTASQMEHWYPYSSELQRKNLSPNGDGSFGTDLNRNFPYLWGGEGSAGTTSNVYWGAGSASEVETQAFVNFALGKDFITAIHGHTFLEVIYASVDSNPVVHEVAYELARYTGYEVRQSATGAGGQNGLTYSMLGAISFTLEYGKEFIPPYEGYGAPGLLTANFEPIRAEHMKLSAFFTEDFTGIIVDGGYGRANEIPASVNGNIALIKRGDGLTYQSKYDNAVAKGAKVVIIYNDEPDIMRLPQIGTPGAVPALVMSGTDGDALANALRTGMSAEVELLANFFIQDSHAQVWNRNIDGLLYMIESAKNKASMVEGTMTDALTGELLSGRIEKTIMLAAPYGGAYAGQIDYYEHQTFIDVQEGQYKWFMAPTKQPFLETPPALLTAFVEGYYPKTLLLEINDFQENKTLNFNLQPVVESQSLKANDTASLNAPLELDFVTVSPLGVPHVMQNVVALLIQNEQILIQQTLVGDQNGRYSLNVDSSLLGVVLGEATWKITFDGDYGSHTIDLPIVFVEGLEIDVETLIAIPSSGNTSHTLEAIYYNAQGQRLTSTQTAFSLVGTFAGVMLQSNGTLTIASTAEEGILQIEAADGTKTGITRIRLVTASNKTQIEAIESQIEALRPVVTQDDSEALVLIREAIDTLGLSEDFIKNSSFLIAAEMKLASLEGAYTALDEIIAQVENAIQQLPHDIDLDDRQRLLEIENMMSLVFTLGGNTSHVSNYATYANAKMVIETTISNMYQEGMLMISALPESIGFEDEQDIISAREYIQMLISLDLNPSEVTNLDILEAAEQAITSLYAENYARVSLFTLGNLGAANHNNSYFVDFDNDVRWKSDYAGSTVYGESFEPLKYYDVSHGTLVTNPRYMQFDISGQGFDFVEGYVGASDRTFSTIEHPTHWRIYLDGVLVYEALNEFNKPVNFYRIDVSNASIIKFELSAEAINSLGWANRTAIMEPTFLRRIDDEMGSAVLAAIDLIDALPITIDLSDETLIIAAREAVDAALVKGATADLITNLSVLENRENQLQTLKAQTIITDLEALIAGLPASIALDDETLVNDVRIRINQAIIAFGITENDITNINDFRAIEFTLTQLWLASYTYTSMFTLGDPGAENRQTSWLVDYETRWSTWDELPARTIFGQSFGPLKFYSVSHGNLHTTPRYVQFDISLEGFQFVQGHVGIADEPYLSDFPLDFIIYGDGVVLFEATLEYLSPAHFYRLDVSDVTWLRFEWSAEAVSGNTYANRIVWVEPQFLIEKQASPEELVESFLRESLPSNVVFDDLYLPLTHPSVDGTIAWASNSEAISPTGEVTYGIEDYLVTLTATYIIAGIEYNIDIDVLVSALDEVLGVSQVLSQTSPNDEVRVKGIFVGYWDNGSTTLNETSSGIFIKASEGNDILYVTGIYGNYAFERFEYSVDGVSLALGDEIEFSATYEQYTLFNSESIRHTLNITNPSTARMVIVSRDNAYGFDLEQAIVLTNNDDLETYADSLPWGQLYKIEGPFYFRASGSTYVENTNFQLSFEIPLDTYDHAITWRTDLRPQRLSFRRSVMALHLGDTWAEDYLNITDDNFVGITIERHRYDEDSYIYFYLGAALSGATTTFGYLQLAILDPSMIHTTRVFPD